MTTLEQSIFINATHENIDRITLDPWQLPNWYAGIRSVEPDGGRMVALGVHSAPRLT